MGQKPSSQRRRSDFDSDCKRRLSRPGTGSALRIKTGRRLLYTTKLETDANFKRMLTYGSIPENARAVHLNVGTHNLFDIAYAMLLRTENQIEPYVSFEMLEGVAEPIRRVVQKLTGDILLYSPVAAREEFLQTIAYLFRRLNENSGSENFMRYIFSLKPGTEIWENQTALFCDSCDEIASHRSTAPHAKPFIASPAIRF